MLIKHLLIPGPVLGTGFRSEVNKIGKDLDSYRGIHTKLSKGDEYKWDKGLFDLKTGKQQIGKKSIASINYLINFKIQSLPS